MTSLTATRPNDQERTMAAAAVRTWQTVSSGFFPPQFLMHLRQEQMADSRDRLMAHQPHISVAKFHRENELTLNVGQYSQQPDFHVQFRYGSRTFNVLFEVDRATESIDSVSDQ